MHLELPVLALLQSIFSFTFGIYATNSTTADFANACYNSTLPSTIPSTANRTIPWGNPSFKFSNGSICCSSLAQVRVGIDEIDEKLLTLLSQRLAPPSSQSDVVFARYLLTDDLVCSARAAYVREATRFKETYATVDNPTRDAQVVNEAVEEAPAMGLPQTIAAAVFETIINSSVLFEQCVVRKLDSFLLLSRLWFRFQMFNMKIWNLNSMDHAVWKLTGGYSLTNLIKRYSITIT